MKGDQPPVVDKVPLEMAVRFVDTTDTTGI